MARKCELHAKVISKNDRKPEAKPATTAATNSRRAEAKKKSVPVAAHYESSVLHATASRYDSVSSTQETEVIDEDVDCDTNRFNYEHGDDHDSASDHSPKERRHIFWHPYQGVPSSSNDLSASALSTSTELGEIQQSVERLRTQRAQVERLGERNQELERQLAYQKAENETLQRVVSTLRGAEQENMAYLQSVKVLEQRARSLEEMCNEKKSELQVIMEKLGHTEVERDQLRQTLKTCRQDHEEEVSELKNVLAALEQHIEQLEHSRGTQSDEQKKLERHWRHKLKDVDRAHAQTVETLQKQLEQSCIANKKFENEVRQLEEQVQNLLATTVRQTKMIEDCDNMIADAKAQQQQTQRSYDEQLQMNGEMSMKIQRLEAHTASLKLSIASEKAEGEKRVVTLENKLTNRKKQLQEAQSALQEKQKEIENMQRDFLQSRGQHLDEMKKEMQHKERKLRSEVSELQIALRDATDEKSMLNEQVAELQARLENERKDRSRWATARLKLLAEFCDEESKLGSALNYHAGSREDGRSSGEKARVSSSRKPQRTRKTVVKQAPVDKCYDGDEEEERRPTSIVFG